MTPFVAIMLALLVAFAVSALAVFNFGQIREMTYAQHQTCNGLALLSFAVALLCATMAMHAVGVNALSWILLIGFLGCIVGGIELIQKHSSDR